MARDQGWGLPQLATDLHGPDSFGRLLNIVLAVFVHHAALVATGLRSSLGLLVVGKLLLDRGDFCWRRKPQEGGSHECCGCQGRQQFVPQCHSARGVMSEGHNERCEHVQLERFLSNFLVRDRT